MTTTIKTDTWYIALSFQYWGRGKTIEEAKRNLKRSGGSFRTMLVYSFAVPQGADAPWIDEMGNSVSDPGTERVLMLATKNGKSVDPTTI